MAIDSQFLAAQSLRDRILAAGAQDGPACRSAPPLPSRTVTDRDPLANLPLRRKAITRPPAPETVYTPFKERAPQRRVERQHDAVQAAMVEQAAIVERAPIIEQAAIVEQVAIAERRLDAAQAALVEHRPHDAPVAFDNALDLDAHTLELHELRAARGNLPRTPPAARHSAWLVATLVFAVMIFGASWLEENQHALVSRQFLAMSRLVVPPPDTDVQPDSLPDAITATPPDAAPVVDVDREPTPESPPAGTSGRTAPSPPASNPTTTAPAAPPVFNPTAMAPAEVRSP
ncbi:MAG TPA: hypothetical protein VG222_17335, partial [Vicinamibacterales bacterium]|nr:hypothetical protein [Vicinamibacterales bacterium]